MTGAIFTNWMTLLTLETFILRISFANTTEVCSLTQTVDPPPLLPTKGTLKTINYQSMPSSAMHTSAVRNLV